MPTNTKGYHLNLYQKGHILLAAIRIFEFENEYAPDIDDLLAFLAVNRENLEHVIRRLEAQGVITEAGSAGARRLFINDHLKLEELKDADKGPSLEDEVARFKEEQNKIGAKVIKMQQEQKVHKQDKFAEMEKKLKEEIAKREKK